MMEQISVLKDCVRGKRKRIEEGCSHSADQRFNNDANSEIPPRKRMKAAGDPPRSHRLRKATKPKTFASLYKVGKKLGEGGFGSVFKGRRLSDGLKVAIKIVKKQEDDPYEQSPVEPRIVPVEVALMQKLSQSPICSTIIQLIEWFDEPDQYILIIERFDPCMDLESFLKLLGGSVSEDIARPLMLQVMNAAIQCRERGVLHRDIKVENLLINTDTFEVKLIDFGCGDWHKKSGYKEFAGTFEYFPPEFHLKGKYHAIPSTVWSLGVSLFRMVEGHLPFTKRQEIIKGELQFSDSLSDECCDVIRSCLQHEVRRRPTLKQLLKHQWFHSNMTS